MDEKFSESSSDASPAGDAPQTNSEAISSQANADASSKADAVAAAPADEAQHAEPSLGNLAGRGLFGGVLMGLANLVPGISGGTMLVAAGVYRRFIDAISDATRLRFRLPSMVLLGSVVVAAFAAIVLLAGPVRDLVVNHRWVMYALFIGLTLGGVPVVWKMVGRPTRGLWVGAVCGLAGMSVLGIAQSMGLTGGGEAAGSWVMLLVAGAVAAGAMILPGISGGYMLLVLGVYVTILTGVDDLKLAIKAREMAAMMDVGLHLLLPVGVGMLIGIVVISNILKIFLHRFEKPTLGVLIGLLLGAVVGLWPFQQGVAPQAGETFKGQEVVQLIAGQELRGGVVTLEDEKYVLEIPQEDSETPKRVEYPAGIALKETGRPIELEKYPTQFFTPSMGQIGGAAGLVVLGFAITCIIGRLGKEE